MDRVEWVAVIFWPIDRKKSCAWKRPGDEMPVSRGQISIPMGVMAGASWDLTQRAAALHYLTNNTRYLILPWVRVAGLASHLLSQVVRRLSQDWQNKYGHPIYLLESFVQRGRFQGTCYRAANRRCVGQTQGRGRQGANPLAPTEPAKDVYLYPLTRHFRRHLLEAA